VYIYYTISRVFCYNGRDKRRFRALYPEDNPARQVRGLRKQSALPRWLTRQEQRKTVPLNRQARRALRAWLSARPDGADDHAFLGQRGEPFTPSALRRRIADLARRAGVEMTLHANHTAALLKGRV